MMPRKLRRDEAPDLTGVVGATVSRKKRTTRGKIRFKKLPAPRSIKPVQKPYMEELRRMNAFLADRVKANITPVLPAVIEEARPKRKDSRNDSYVDDIRRAMGFAKVAFYRQYTPQEIEGIARKQAGRIDAFNSAEFDRMFGAVLGIRIPRSDTWLGTKIQNFVAENVSLITTLDETHFGKIEQAILRNVQTGMIGKDVTEAVQDIIDNVEDIEGSSEARADLIARDQTSKFNSSLNEARQTEVGVNKYVWSTSLDERVRESHAEKEGEVFSWDDPPADTGHPGQDIQCRCVALPYFDESQIE